MAITSTTTIATIVAIFIILSDHSDNSWNRLIGSHYFKLREIFNIIQCGTVLQIVFFSWV